MKPNNPADYVSTVERFTQDGRHGTQGHTVGDTRRLICNPETREVFVSIILNDDNEPVRVTKTAILETLEGLNAATEQFSFRYDDTNVLFIH